MTKQSNPIKRKELK